MKRKRLPIVLIVLCLWIVFSAVPSFASTRAIDVYVRAQKTTKNVKLNKGDSLHIKTHSGKAVINAKGLTYTSSNKSVAKVSAQGVVNALKNGNTTITVKTKDNKKSAVIKVTVTSEKIAHKPVISESSISLNVDDDMQLFVYDTDDTVEWSSSAYKIAAVTSNGFVIARNYGTCIIQARTAGRTLKCKVSVTLPVPKCYPQKESMSDGFRNVYIQEFDAKFVSYKPVKSASLYKQHSFSYYFPYIYRIHLKGKVSKPTSGEIYFRIGILWKGVASEVPGNNMISFKANSDGTFDITENIRMSSPAEYMYLT